MANWSRFVTDALIALVALLGWYISLLMFVVLEYEPHWIMFGLFSATIGIVAAAMLMRFRWALLGSYVLLALALPG